MSSSSIPTLTPTLFYTESDAYNYLTDNRPIYNLDNNIKTIASSLVGLGYGEHSSVNGGLLSPGRGVELLQTGQIRYPVDQATVVGIVVGGTSAGLNKVIWGSTHLDLDALGLSNLFPAAVDGSYIVCSQDGTGSLSVKVTPLSGDIVLGRIKQNSYISIGLNTSTGTSTVDPTPSINSHNLYGFSRMRNILLFGALDSMPVQFTKKTKRQSDLGLTLATSSTVGTINPLNIALNINNKTVGPASTSTISYSGYSINSVTSSWILKETFTRFPDNNAGTLAYEAVSYNSNTTPTVTTTSTWPTLAYGNPHLTNYDNYELDNIDSVDYSSSTLATDIFRRFSVTRYYSYAMVISSSPAYGKPTARLTVFDPVSQGLGGENRLIIVCDFTQYDVSTGLETRKDRVILTDAAANSLYSDTNVFTNSLLNL